MDFNLKMVEVEFKEEFLDALSLHQPPLCVVEWRIPIKAARLTEAKLLAEGAPDYVASALAGFLTEAIPVHEVFEEAVRRSPDTKFVIACHNKGYDVPKAHVEDYMRNPAAIKRMGFINGSANMRYLAKLFTRTYAGRTWKPTF